MKLHVLKIIFYFSFFLFSHCYYNPVVNSLLNPAETEENNTFLGLLGLSGQPLLITGQIRDANGVAESGLVLQLGKTFAPQSKSISSGIVTDAGGRFYFPYQTGSISFTVYRNDLYYFEFTLDVASQTEITASKYGAPPTLEITGLGTVNPSEVGNFFELVRAYTFDGEMNEILLNAIVDVSVYSISLQFSEPPIPAIDTGPLVTDWISQNISASPSVSFDNAMVVSENTLTISPMNLGAFQIYEITLKPSILSASGKSLTQRTIRFEYQPP